MKTGLNTNLQGEKRNFRKLRITTDESFTFATPSFKGINDGYFYCADYLNHTLLINMDTIPVGVKINAYIQVWLPPSDNEIQTTLRIDLGLLKTGVNMIAFGGNAPLYQGVIFYQINFNLYVDTAGTYKVLSADLLSQA